MADSWGGLFPPLPGLDRGSTGRTGHLRGWEVEPQVGHGLLSGPYKLERLSNTIGGF